MHFTYKGLKAQLEKHTVTDAEVDRQLQRLLEQSPRIVLVDDRPTERGDEVILDYAGFCDGVQFPGGTAENQTLVLGSGMFIPGFEEQLLDKVPGENVTVKVTFPQQYHSEELAGKEAEFRCVIHQIRVKTPYQLDDVFAQEVGQCENLEQMQQKLKQSLQQFADERGEMDLQDRLLRQAAATLECSFTEAQLEEAVDQQMQSMESQLARQGVNLEMYCSFMQTTPEALRKDAYSAAENALRSQAAIDRIVLLEALTVEPHEFDEALAIIARQNRITLEQLQQYRNSAFDQAVRNGVLQGKVMQFIRFNAIITE
jgi:trigger factor